MDRRRSRSLYGNTNLDGFAVRFAGPVRWNSEVAWGPAVIGMTDNFDPGYGEARQNFTFTHLDLEIPPIEKNEGWIEAVAPDASDTSPRGRHRRQPAPGRADRVFRGAMAPLKTTIFGEPSLVRFSHAVFSGHGTYDLFVRGNRASSPAPSGKTWRFLVLTGQGTGDIVDQ